MAAVIEAQGAHPELDGPRARAPPPSGRVAARVDQRGDSEDLRVGGAARWWAASLASARAEAVRVVLAYLAAG